MLYVRADGGQRNSKPSDSAIWLRLLTGINPPARSCREQNSSLVAYISKLGMGLCRAVKGSARLHPHSFSLNSNKQVFSHQFLGRTIAMLCNAKKMLSDPFSAHY